MNICICRPKIYIIYICIDFSTFLFKTPILTEGIKNRHILGILKLFTVLKKKCDNLSDVKTVAGLPQKRKL
jgi:hypothetical protein